MKQVAQNILVGGSGFIGSELALALVQRGETVVSISRHDKADTPGIKNLLLDIMDKPALKERFPQGETVYILVGQNHSEFDTERELGALRNLIEVLNERPPKKVLYLSSALVYGETDVPATEETSCHPADQYSQFKCVAEALLRERLDSKIALGILRLANVYGGRKNRGFIGLVMTRLIQEEKNTLIVNGDGLQERDYIFIDDVVAALIAVREGLVMSDTVNIATGESHTLLDILDEVSVLTGRPFLYEKNNKKLVEVRKSRVSNTKLAMQYGFSPHYGLRSGLRETYARSGKPEMKISGGRFLFIGGEGFIGRNIADYFSRDNECVSVGKRRSPFTKRYDAYYEADPYRDVIDGTYDVVVHLIDNKVSLSEFESEEKKLVEHFTLRPNGHLIVFSSAVVYANPDSEYGKRKRALEEFYTRYCAEHGIVLTIFRPFNIFGPYQMPYRQGSLIANLMCNFLLERNTEISDMDAKRDFMYVADIARFVEHVLVRKQSGVFDIGSGNLLRIRELIDYLDRNVIPIKGKIIDRHLKEQTSDQPAKSTLFSYLPMVDFDEGLKMTLAFYQDNIQLLQEYAKRQK